MNPTLDEKFQTFNSDFLTPMTQLRARLTGSNQVNMGLRWKTRSFSKTESLMSR